MDEIFEQLNEVIEARVAQNRNSMVDGAAPESQRKRKEKVGRMDRILRMLPEKERSWLDNQLLEQTELPEQEQIKFYKAGLSDAIDFLRFLKT